ncbi:MAG: DUF4097 family beta strand repeat-containing protein [Oscillospiraceae bacterium]
MTRSFWRYGVPSLMILGGLVAAGIGWMLFERDGLPAEFDVTNTSGTVSGAEGVTNLDIEMDLGSLKILPADTFSYTASDVVADNFSVSAEGDTLKLRYQFNWKATLSLWFTSWDDSASVTLYVPQRVYENLTLNSGAGSCTVKALQCTKANLDLGAGSLTMNDVSVNEEANFDCGAGKVTISDCKLNNAEFDMGAGSFTANGGALYNLTIDGGAGNLTIDGAVVTGKTDVDAGAGRVTIHAVGNPEDYYADVDQGAGSVDENTRGGADAPNKIIVDGGAGSVDISIGS